MADKAWKSLERKAARLTGGECERFNALDVNHPSLAIECKHRERLSVWTWFRKLETKAGDKLPVLVLKEKGKQGELAVVRLNALLSLLKGIDEK